MPENQTFIVRWYDDHFEKPCLVRVADLWMASAMAAFVAATMASRAIEIHALEEEKAIDG